MKHAALLLLTTMTLAAPAAYAQDATSLFSGKDGKPISVNADSLEWRQNDNMYVAQGAAQVSQGDLTITADTLDNDSVLPRRW